MSDDKIHLFEDFTFDQTRGFLLRGDELVHLRPQTYEVLKYLVNHRGRLISKDKLIEDVWQGRAVTDGSLGKCIEELREALGEHALEYIRNVRGRGYIFDAEANGKKKIEAKSEQFDVLRVVVTDEEQDGGPLHIVEGIRKHRLGFVIALAALLLTAGALGYWYFAARSTKWQPLTSVVVLPFLNESGDPDTEYLSDGISESLINSLSQLSQLKVIARSSSFKYKGNAFEPQKVANALGVQGIVTGRIVQRGDNLLVSVELMDARDKRQVWGEQYNRRASDLPAVQTEISREIAEKLRLHLSAGEQQKLAKLNTVNPEAYDLLIKGRFHWRKGGPENQKKAVEYFNQAIAVDPTYALAYAELGTRYEVLYAGSWLDPTELKPKAEAAVRRALELDDGLAEAHFALGNLRRSAWDWTAAEHEYKRAIELNPNLAEAHSFYAFYLVDTGRYEEAIAEAKRARELDPLSLFKNVLVGNTLAAARRYDAAIESLKMTLEMDRSYAPAHFTLGFIYVAKGMYPEAIAAYHENIRLGDDSPSGQIYLGAAYAKAGEREKAQRILKRLQTSREYVSPAELSILYAALGEREQAFASLEKAYAAHDLQLQFLGADVSFDSLRGDPRFKDLMRRIGLTP